MQPIGIFAIATVILLSGCTQTTTSSQISQTSAGTEQTTTETTTTYSSPTADDAKANLENAKTQTQAALRSTGDAMNEEKIKLGDQLNAAGKTIDLKISELQAKMASATADQKVKMHAQIEHLKSERPLLDQMKTDVGNASKSTWNSVKANWNNMRASMDEHMAEHKQAEVEKKATPQDQ